MAKKIFCDVCGEEMSYDGIQPHLKGHGSAVQIKGHEATIEYTVAVLITPTKTSGAHIDTCNDCRFYILGKLDKRPKPADQLGG